MRVVGDGVARTTVALSPARKLMGGDDMPTPRESRTEWNRPMRYCPGGMLSIRKAPVESLSPKRVVPSTDICAPRRGLPRRLSTATPARTAVFAAEREPAFVVDCAASG